MKERLVPRIDTTQQGAVGLGRAVVVIDNLAPAGAVEGLTQCRRWSVSRFTQGRGLPICANYKKEFWHLMLSVCMHTFGKLLSLSFPIIVRFTSTVHRSGSVCACELQNVTFEHFIC